MTMLLKRCNSNRIDVKIIIINNIYKNNKMNYMLNHIFLKIDKFTDLDY